MDMVERVSVAILSRVPAAYRMSPDEAEELARAAMEAMRLPTEEMVQSVEWYFTNGGKGQRLRDLYTVMVDVALGRLPPKKLWSVIEDEKRKAALTSSEKG